MGKARFDKIYDIIKQCEIPIDRFESINFSFPYSPLPTQCGFSQQIGVHFRFEER